MAEPNRDVGRIVVPSTSVKIESGHVSVRVPNEQATASVMTAPKDERTPR